MKRTLLQSVACMLLVAFTITDTQAQIIINGPAGSGNFGTTITVLTNGNYVVTDPGYDEGSVLNVGAVYLYNGVTHALISMLKGSVANDAVGNGGITALGSGNFVVRSAGWDNGPIVNAGAVTWCSGTAGLSGTVSSANSLTGSQTSDQVGSVDITALPNGNYVVRSGFWDNGPVRDAGAVTWGSGTTGISGPVSSSNSLVGDHADDFAGGSANSGNRIIILTNSNYVVRTNGWDNGAIRDAGAVTWGDGTSGVSGIISTLNSLTGSRQDDNVGFYIAPLTNGNYVVTSQYWDNDTAIDAGAATWCNGATGTRGVVSTTNSLIGGAAGNRVGNQVATALTNGHYVVVSEFWDNGTTQDVGAVTWCNGTTGTVGVVSGANSLTGSTAGDQIGYGGASPLTNGNYVVQSIYWDNGAAADAGAVTWCDGTTGRTGAVTTLNSLVGSKTTDYVGSGITTLNNGNYVIRSNVWDNGSIINAGAATWGSGTSGVAGPVSAANSIVGSRTNDQVANSGIAALTNGNFVVPCSGCDNGTLADAGAVTWGNGATGTAGVVSTANSLMGSKAGDAVGLRGITALTNGHYVAHSPLWDNGTITDAGASIWCDGTTGRAGTFTPADAVVGGKAGDQIGNSSATALSNGNYVLLNPLWDNGNIADAGAATWCDGATGRTGLISTANSLTGSTAGDGVSSSGITAVDDGNYIVSSSNWDNGTLANAGAATSGSGTTGVSGSITGCNSVLGSLANGGSSFVNVYNPVYGYLLAGLKSENRIVINRSGPALAGAGTTATESLSNGSVQFIDGSCQLIATVLPSGTTPVAGSTTATAYVQGTAPAASGGQRYVRRYHDITPAAGRNEATAVITLYYSQADFTDYNGNNGSDPDLPTGPADITGIANFRITQQHGVSSTGLPGSYSGWGGAGPANIVINPSDNDIVWNSGSSRWEVAFEVTGFSGFFAFGSNNNVPLPVKPESIAASAEGKRNRIDWRVATATTGASFDIERSADANSFETIGMSSTGNGSKYTFYDEQPLSPVSYYRLNIKEAGGDTYYTRIVSVHRNSTGSVVAAPVPATNTISIINTNIPLNGTRADIVDMQGRNMMSFVLQGVQEISIQGLAAGAYSLRLADGSVLRIVKH